MDPKETTVYFYLVIASTFLALILLFFLISFINQQRKYRTLNTAKVNAELNTLETERKRMARDLHDELGPVLSAAKNLLQSIDELSETDEKLRNEAIAFIDQTIVKMRQVARSLMPESLLKKGLPFAIQEFIDSTIKNNLEIIFTHEPVGLVSEQITLQAYHIVQEIVHNTIKHAQASQCVIHLNVADNKLIIQTADNGKGYDQATVKYNKPGLGIAIMESRVTLLHGQVSILSEKNKGTQHYITIPLNLSSHDNDDTDKNYHS